MNPIYFISDLHLSSVESPITKSFFDFLDNKISTPTSLYILGDLFEVGSEMMMIVNLQW